MKDIFIDIVDAFRTFTLVEWKNHIFAATPTLNWDLRGLYAALILVLLVAALVIQFSRFHQPYKERWLNFLWINVFLGIVLFFFRYERIPYLGSDLLRVVHEIALLFWVNTIIWYRRTGYKAEMLGQVVAARREKYLPKPKK